MEKVLSNKLPTLRNQMMKKLMSFQSVLHRVLHRFKIYEYCNK